MTIFANTSIDGLITRVSEENCSSVLLAANEEFVGEWVSMLDVAELDITQTCDVPGTLYIDGSDDEGTTIATFPFPNITTITIRSPLSRRSARVRFLNGPTPQTKNHLQTLLRPLSPGVSALPIESPTFPQTIAQTTRAVMTAKNTGGSYSNIQMGQKPKDESLPVTIANDQPTINVTVSSLPLPTGAATEPTLLSAKIDLDDIKVTNQNIDVLLSSRLKVADMQADLSVSSTAAVGLGVTATLPATASKFHVIRSLEITQYAINNTSGTATPISVTTTNLNSASFFMPTLLTKGDVHREKLEPAGGIKSTIANTPTTIVCPATPNIIWKVNIFYNLTT